MLPCNIIALVSVLCWYITIFVSCQVRKLIYVYFPLYVMSSFYFDMIAFDENALFKRSGEVIDCGKYLCVCARLLRIIRINRCVIKIRIRLLESSMQNFVLVLIS